MHSRQLRSVIAVVTCCLDVETPDISELLMYAHQVAQSSLKSGGRCVHPALGWRELSRGTGAVTVPAVSCVSAYGVTWRNAWIAANN
jgi:hypothetical protein